MIQRLFLIPLLAFPVLLPGSPSPLLAGRLPVITAAGAETPKPERSSESQLPLIVPAAVASHPAVSPPETSDETDHRQSRTKSATESASRRAREEWQKEFLAARRKQQVSGEAGRKKTAKSMPSAAPNDRRQMRPEKKKSGKSTSSAASASTLPLPQILPQPVRLPRYIDIYRSIPFSRTQYDADPLYRHQAAMELLLGRMRPSAPSVSTDVDVSVQALPVYRWSYPIRSGYRTWSRYPWH